MKLTTLAAIIGLAAAGPSFALGEMGLATKADCLEMLREQIKQAKVEGWVVEIYTDESAKAPPSAADHLQAAIDGLQAIADARQSVVDALMAACSSY